MEKAAKVLSEKLSKYHFTLKVHRMIAQALYPRISNNFICTDHKCEFSRILWEVYRMASSSEKDVESFQKDSDINALPNAAPSARKEAPTPIDEVSDFFKLTKTHESSRSILHLRRLIQEVLAFLG